MVGGFRREEKEEKGKMELDRESRRRKKNWEYGLKDVDKEQIREE